MAKTHGLELAKIDHFTGGHFIHYGDQKWRSPLPENGKTRASRAARELSFLVSRLAAERAKVRTKVCKGQVLVD